MARRVPERHRPSSRLRVEYTAPTTENRSLRYVLPLFALFRTHSSPCNPSYPPLHPTHDATHLQLNASDDRGIDVVREQIKNFAETRTLFAKGYKLIVLDEADMMTTAAQSALRRVIEQYTKNVRFCIICNYVNKIIPAIQSRCTRFRFSPLPISEVEKRVDSVIEAEGYASFRIFVRIGCVLTVAMR